MFDDHVKYYDPVHLELQIITRTKRICFSDPACAQTCSLGVMRTRWPLSYTASFTQGCPKSKRSNLLISCTSPTRLLTPHSLCVFSSDLFSVPDFELPVFLPALSVVPQFIYLFFHILLLNFIRAAPAALKTQPNLNKVRRGRQTVWCL